MKAKNTIEHRRRKNGAAREAWERRKKERNAARPKQIVVTYKGVEGEVERIVGPLRDASAAGEPDIRGSQRGRRL